MPAPTRIAAILSAILLAPVLLCAQNAQSNPDTPSPQTGPYLKLVYRTLQIGADGKAVNSHSYSTIVVANTGHASPSQIRSNDRVPITVGNSVNAEYQYQD